MKHFQERVLGDLCKAMSPYQPYSPKKPDPTKATLLGFYWFRKIYLYIYALLILFVSLLILKVLFSGVYISVAFEFYF